VFTGAAVMDKSSDKEPRATGGEARLWRTDTGKPIGPVLAHRGPVMAVAFNADGRLALTGGIVLGNSASPDWHGEARLWRTAPDDPRVGEQLGPILEHPAPVWSLAFSPSGQCALTGAEDARLRLWFTAT